MATMESVMRMDYLAGVTAFIFAEETDCKLWKMIRMTKGGEWRAVETDIAKEETLVGAQCAKE